MTLSSNEILAKIPGSWAELTLAKWLEFMSLRTYKPEADDPLSDVYVSLQVISSITGLDMDIVQQFPMELIKQANKKLSFLSASPDKGYKSKRKWITKVEDPTYDEFITFVNVSKQINEGDYSGFPLIIKSIIREPITDEEILALTMDEVNAAFFLLRRSLRKFLKSTTRTLETEATRLTVIEKMTDWEVMTFSKKSKTIRELFKELMGGTFWEKRSPSSQDSHILR
jgi:hypothetical protein